MSKYIESQDHLYRTQQDPWGNIDPSHPRFNLYQQKFLSQVATILPRYRTIVDLTCGIGKLVDLINTSTDKEAIGVDSSPTAIQRARENFPRWHYEQADMRTWNPRFLVDMVMITAAYHHLGEAERHSLLERIYGYLQKGGACLISYPTNRLMTRSRNRYNLDVERELFSVFSPQQVVSFMMRDNENGEECGFTYYVGEK